METESRASGALAASRTAKPIMRASSNNGVAIAAELWPREFCSSISSAGLISVKINYLQQISA